MTEQSHRVPAVVCVKEKGMKEAWCLVVSDLEARAAEVINLYGKGRGIEITFRDIKDHKFALGMAHVHTTSPARRDRLFLLSALTIALLTTRGAAGDSIRLEGTIKRILPRGATIPSPVKAGIYHTLVDGMRKNWQSP